MTWTGMSPTLRLVAGRKTCTGGTVDAAKLAGILYAPAAFAAMGAEFVLKPAAEKTSEYLTPMFIGGISQAYGLPDQYLWSWQ
jgi:hypothetical protein